MRPTRFCTCGEYVDDRPVTRRVAGGRFVTKTELVHINGDGVRIDRAHKPQEDTQ